MSCENNELAKNGPFQLHRCRECDGFSLHLGPVTLRLDEQAVRSLGQMLQEGLARLDRNRHAPATLSTNLVFPTRANSDPSS